MSFGGCKTTIFIFSPFWTDWAYMRPNTVYGKVGRWDTKIRNEKFSIRSLMRRMREVGDLNGDVWRYVLREAR